MAEEKKIEERDPTPPDQAQVGETWKSNTTSRSYKLLYKGVDTFTAERDDGRHVALSMSQMRENKFRRVTPHDFSDRYCAARHVDGTIVPLCRSCGMSETLAAETESCKPREWRADLEAYVAVQMQEKDKRRVVPERPRYAFRQSNPLICGGVFSLRDENALRRR